MLIKIQAIQVPKFWEVIKFSAVKTDGIEEEYQRVYCLTLLQDLLSGKKNCVIAIDNDKIVFVALFSLNVHPMTQIKYLLIGNVYAFEHQSDANWIEIFDDSIKIAKSVDCKVIAVNTTNPRVITLAKRFNFKLFSSKYYCYL